MTHDPHRSTTDVRQGNRRLMNFRVLIISMILVVLAFGLVYLIFATMPPATSAG